MEIDSHEFVDVVTPGLRAGHASALAEAVKKRWTPREIASLLGASSPDVRRCAALVLGLIGDNAAVGPLARVLRDDDEQVHQMAEHALWSIWFRGCTCTAIEPFERGAQWMALEHFEDAIQAFTQALASCPEFAEAYNQRAIAHFFAGRYEQSAEDCRHALRLMPSHFGAAAGLGHCLCHLGDLNGALEAYRKALHINPRMPPVQSAARRLETKLARQDKPAKKARCGYSLN